MTEGQHHDFNDIGKATPTALSSRPKSDITVGLYAETNHLGVGFDHGSTFESVMRVIR